MRAGFCQLVYEITLLLTVAGLPMKVGFNTSGQEVGFLKPQLPLNQGERG